MRHSGDIVMTEGNLPVKMVRFALPILLSGWLQLLYSVADLVVCGMFGSANSVGAISATNSLTQLIISLFVGLSVGSNVVMSRAYGALNKGRGERTIGSSMALAIYTGLILSLLGVTMSKVFLRWMGTPSDIISLSTSYMTIYFIGIPFMMVYNFGAAVMRGMGDTRKPFYYLTASGALNILLNLLFVIIFKMDVAGVAWATVISQAVASAGVVFSLTYEKRGFACLRLRYIRLYRDETKEIIRVGLPAGIQGSLYAVSNVIIQSSINSFGSYADTGSGAASSIEGFMFFTMDSFAQAGVAFIAANYGAKNIVNIKKSVRWALTYACLASFLAGSLIFLLRTPLISIYTSDPRALEIGTQRLAIISLTYVSFALVDTFGYIDRGLGYSTLPMIVSLAGIGGLRLLYIFTFFRMAQFHSLTWLFITYPLSWVITAAAHIICYLAIRKKALAKALSGGVSRDDASVA